MTISIKCSICEIWFGSQESYDKHIPCNGQSIVGSAGSKDYLDKYAKKGTGRP